MIKIGDKVRTFSKSAGCGYCESKVIEGALDNKQGFLYVVDIIIGQDITYKLSHLPNGKGEDFMIYDLCPFREFIEKKEIVDQVENILIDFFEWDQYEENIKVLVKELVERYDVEL